MIKNTSLNENVPTKVLKYAFVLKLQSTGFGPSVYPDIPAGVPLSVLVPSELT